VLYLKNSNHTAVIIKNTLKIELVQVEVRLVVRLFGSGSCSSGCGIILWCAKRRHGEDGGGPSAEDCPSGLSKPPCGAGWRKSLVLSGRGKGIFKCQVSCREINVSELSD
jgi:hypothetical protein